MHKTLIILPNNIGDIFMATPLLRSLKEAKPESHTTFFIEDKNQEILTKNPYINCIYPFNRASMKKMLHSSEWKNGAIDVLNHINTLRTSRFTSIINLSQHDYTALLASLLSSSMVVGRWFRKEGIFCILDQWSQYLYACAFARRYNSLHAADIYKRIGGCKFNSRTYTYILLNSEKQWAHEYLKSHGLLISETNGIVVFAPGAALCSKRWIPEYYIRLGKRLLEHGWEILVCGAPQEVNLCHSISQAIGAGCHCAAGDCTFRQSVSLLSFARYCVSGDTALMHAAAALGVTSLALFGPTSPVETGPYGTGHRVFSGSCMHKPCFKSTCENLQCMASITPDVIAESILNYFPYKNYGISTYTTGFTEYGDYVLKPNNAVSFSDYTSCGARLTQALIDNQEMGIRKPEADIHPDCLHESQLFCLMVEKMLEHLAAYRQTGTVSSIQAFEEQKKQLAGIPGIAQFWTALLNIRLNSIPVFDVLRAVEQSYRVCDQLIHSIKVMVTKQ